MPISASHLPKVLDRMTSDQCLEVLHHSSDQMSFPRDQEVARTMFYGIRPAHLGTLYLLERNGREYRLTGDGAQVKAALEARA